MQPTKDQLNFHTLCASFGKDAEALDVYVFEELDSTNTHAKRLAVENIHARPSLIVAARQTAGRGRMGRSFYSPDQTGVYFSLSYEVSAPLDTAVSITCAASVAVMRAIRDVCGVQTDIKWVNDLYLNRKKVCGILAESVCIENATRVILGIGINLRTVNFPEELADKAGSLGDTNVRRAELIAAVWRELKPFLANPDDAPWLADYRAHSCVIGKPITFVREGRTCFGVAESIDGQGTLAVRLSDGSTEHLRTGEISIHFKNE